MMFFKRTSYAYAIEMHRGRSCTEHCLVRSWSWRRGGPESASWGTRLRESGIFHDIGPIGSDDLIILKGVLMYGNPWKLLNHDPIRLGMNVYSVATGEIARAPYGNVILTEPAPV